MVRIIRLPRLIRVSTVSPTLQGLPYLAYFVSYPGVFYIIFLILAWRLAEPQTTKEQAISPTGVSVARAVSTNDATGRRRTNNIRKHVHAATLITPLTQRNLQREARDVPGMHTKSACLPGLFWKKRCTTQKEFRIVVLVRSGEERRTCADRLKRGFPVLRFPQMRQEL